VRFENPHPDETVNYSTEHPLKEFAWLLAGVAAVVAAAVALAGFFAGELAARVPFRVEKEYAGGIARHWEARDLTPEAAEARAALRAIAAKLVPAMSLPPGMEVTVHYADDKTVNAMATLGGNVVFYRGLLERLDSEDAVATVLAHEIAHAKLRHPASALGRGVAVGIVLSVVSSSMGRSVGGDPVELAGMLSLLKYNRDQERAADQEALAAIAAVYGHVGGAREVFAVLGKLGRDESARVAILETHPLGAERLARVDELARERGWAPDGPRRALPPALAKLKPAKRDG
jgi:beta-barrel assembly-enhancing protease